MLQIRDLHKSYGKAAALAGVDLDVAKGETVVIMGPSGCGKSTLIRCVNRLTEPDSGSIILGGQDVLALTGPELQQFRRKVGFVFQHFNLIARLTVLDNVMFHLVLAGMDRDQAGAGAGCPGQGGAQGGCRAQTEASSAEPASEWVSPGP